MTKEEAIVKLKELQTNGEEPEDNHLEADGILCELLETLGFKEVTSEYEEIYKRYA